MTLFSPHETYFKDAPTPTYRAVISCPTANRLSYLTIRIVQRLPKSHPKHYLETHGAVTGANGPFKDDEWISKQLEMGHRSNVSRAVSAFREPSSKQHRQLRKLLHVCTD